MAGILLTNTYFLHLDPKQEQKMEPYPPLGTLYAAAVLRNAGHPVQYLDNVFEKDTTTVEHALETSGKSIFVIYDDGFNYLTKMCLVNMRNACFAMIRKARSLNYKVIISSSDATDHAEAYLRAGADFIIIGEAEQTLLELIHQIEQGYPCGSISGITYIHNNQLIKTPSRPVRTDLDALPFPAWDLQDLSAYQNKWKNNAGHFSLNVTTTRGCPFKCNWCAKPIYGNRYNARSPENVVEEITLLIQQYGVSHFWFCDDIFGLKPGWITLFSKLVQERNLKFRYKIQCRADLLLDENNIAHLAASGCDEVWIGAESGSQKILDAMEKGTTVEQISSAAQLMQRHGIKPCFFLQFGYPGETASDIQATLDMVRLLKPYDIGISVSYPLPGTKFYEKVKAEFGAQQNWNDSDDLLMMYRGTYAPGYYRQLHRYVHKRFRAAQGLLFLQDTFRAEKKYWNIPLKRVIALPYYLAASGYYRIRTLHPKQST